MIKPAAPIKNVRIRNVEIRLNNRSARSKRPENKANIYLPKGQDSIAVLPTIRVTVRMAVNIWLSFPVQTRPKPATKRSIILIPMKGAIMPPTP